MRATVLVHGGAGALRAHHEEHGRAYREGLAVAARAGREALARGEPALAAAVAATKVLEAAGVFNAGLGACLDEEAGYCLDAALMRGEDRAAGAVGALGATYHAVDVCLDLLREGRHVLLVGEGADRRARALALPPLPPPGEATLARFRKLKAERAARAPADPTGPPRHDTVGVVVVDAQGRVASAVSTGGIWLKARFRVGDSAIVGAGLYACDDLGAAASATGIGERMIRNVTCYTACQAAQARGAAAAAREAVAALAARFGPDSGGLAVLDREGGAGCAFNTQGMGRALARVGEDAVAVAVWPEEPFPA